MALAGMAFGFDEPGYQSVAIRGLDHPDPDVREAAAWVVMWDEPVAAEVPLLRAAADPSGAVAAEAVATLRYYPSRRVLRVLAELTENGDESVRAVALESFEENRGRFEDLAAYGDPEPVALLREWMEPVADLVRWPDEVQARRVWSPPADPPRIAVSENDLLALLADPDGEWRPKRETLRQIDWERYAPDERERLCTAITTHPDPVVREAATEPVAAWSMGDALLGLARDPSYSVRKSAVYHLGSVPRDPALAAFAWEYMLGAGGMRACEALRTYVAHASAREARERLTELARTDARESIRIQAISSLTELGAGAELESLAPLLREPPGVSWAVHVEIIDGLRRLGLGEPDLDHLAAVDNLDLVSSVIGRNF